MDDVSRSNYSEDGNDDNWALIRWRGMVASASRGKRGQRLFRDLVAALDAMPAKRLIKNNLVQGGEVCALGAVGQMRTIPMEDMDPEDADTVGAAFDIATCLAQEVTWINDEYGPWKETPEDRWERLRKWAASQITPPEPLERGE